MSDFSDLDRLLTELAMAKEAKEHAAEAYEQASEALSAYLDPGAKSARGIDVYTEDQISVTKVNPVDLKVDEARLRRRLGAKVWTRVSKSVLDKSKLEAAVAMGEVSIQDVAECTEERPKKPYWKIKVRRQEEPK